MGKVEFDICHPDFENLKVYCYAKELNREILHFVKNNKHIDPYLRDQLRRASISIVINIAEGSGKFSKADKRNFYTIARGSTYECVSLFDIIHDEQQITDAEYKKLY
ncbi:MAG: S23 ribosomal protein [Parcubacteria group bacterium Gr01-1014_48]|nr:MAG: S23 ribosomal protein [Parcubacteria group bacterium Gr01-1014_48]